MKVIMDFLGARYPVMMLGFYGEVLVAYLFFLFASYGSTQINSAAPGWKIIRAPAAVIAEALPEDLRASWKSAAFKTRSAFVKLSNQLGKTAFGILIFVLLFPGCLLIAIPMDKAVERYVHAQFRALYKDFRKKYP